MGTVGKIICEGRRDYSLHEVEGLRLAPLWRNRFCARGRGCLSGGVPLSLQEVEGWRAAGGGKVRVGPCGGWSLPES